MTNAQAQTKERVADLLKRSRCGALIKQTAMADLLGVSSRTIIAWEKGDTEPPTSAVLEWLRITDRPLSDLLKCAPWDLNPEPADYGAQGVLPFTDWPERPRFPPYVNPGGGENALPIAA